MKVFKYQALGNDYLVINRPHSKLNLNPKFIQKICDRNYGIGSDGVLWHDKKRYSLRIYNPDGSEAEKSGNGLRIFARFCFDYLHAGERFHIQLPHEKISVALKTPDAGMIEVEMGKPEFESAKIPINSKSKTFIQQNLQVGNHTFIASAVSMGNPHCVIFVNDFNTDWAKKFGALIENHPMFPNRTNVQFAKVLDEENIQISIWERGAGFTLASGSSSCAVASVCRKLNLTKNNVTVHMPGGRIKVNIPEDVSNVFMTGEVKPVFEAKLNKQFLKEFL